MTFKFSATSVKRMDGVNARLVDVAELALELSPIDFGIPELGGLRNADEQLLLFFNGKSQLDGTKKRSNHQSGKALDVFAYVDGKASWDENHLTTVAAAMLEAASRLDVRVAWGGHWKNFKDMPHFEVIG